MIEGLKVRIGEVEYQCVGQCGNDWVFIPINQDDDEAVVYSDMEIAAMKDNNAFELLEEASL